MFLANSVKCFGGINVYISEFVITKMKSVSFYKCDGN